MSLRILSFVPSLALTLPCFGIQGTSVLLLHTEGANLPAGAEPLLQAELMSTGQFASVDTFDCSATGNVPVAADLIGFDVILCYSRSEFLDPVATGDVLAAQAAAGQAIVLGPAAASNDPDFGLGGLWLSESRSLLNGADFQLSANEVLGTIFVPTHPAVQVLTALDGGMFSVRPEGGVLDGDATVLAEYMDGSPLIIAGPTGRVDLGIWPGDFTGPDGLDGADALNTFANSLLFAALGGLGNNYCGAAVPNSSGLPAITYALGTGIAGDPLTLSASGLPEGQFAFFVAARNQAFVPSAGGSQGNLCLGSGTARFLAQSGMITAGTFGIEVDTSQIPFSSAGVMPILSGETLNFTCWYRDVNPTSTSNFADALEVTFE